jgi:cytoskeletal protein RodZ
MSNVAQQLSQARQAQNLTVSQAAEITKIRGDYLRALEEGHYDAFPAPVYIRGFVKTYATLLKLNVPQVMAALDDELGQTEKFAEPPPLSGRSRGLLDFVTLLLSKVNWRKALPALGTAVLLAAVMLIILAWRHHQTTDPLKGLKPGMYQAPSNHAGQTLPLPGRPSGR